MGFGDMLEVAHMGLHVAQMTGQQGIHDCFNAVTTHAAQVMHLKGYGLDVGCDASFVLLQARDPVEAIRQRANRLKVWKRGILLAETPEVVARLTVANRADRPAFFKANGASLAFTMKFMRLKAPATRCPPARRPWHPARALASPGG